MYCQDLFRGNEQSADVSNHFNFDKITNGKMLYLVQITMWLRNVDDKFRHETKACGSGNVVYSSGNEDLMDATSHQRGGASDGGHDGVFAEDHQTATTPVPGPHSAEGGNGEVGDYRDDRGKTCARPTTGHLRFGVG